jgi:glutamate carboxypeptidase
MSIDPWVAAAAPAIAERAERELEALVGVSSPSGDVRGAEEAVAIVSAVLPPGVERERIPCSTPGHAPDLLVRLCGEGRLRLLLLGHLDTVVPHEAHAPLAHRDGRLTGSGTVDMKGGVALAVELLRALAHADGEPPSAASAPRFAEVSLLLVNDEEWRRYPFAHAERFAGYDACLCFEAGERGPNGEEGVVIRRKAAGTLRVEAHGASAHSGSAPDAGRNALLALAAAAERVADFHAPHGQQRLSAVPTILRAGEAFNVVPASGELFCDIRADRLEAIEPVGRAVPAEVGGVRLEAELIRRWPGMDAREATRGLLALGSERLGRPIVGAERGGASDASHLAPFLELTVDGLGPRGSGAHAPDEHIVAASLRERAEVALALVAALADARR